MTWLWVSLSGLSSTGFMRTSGTQRARAVTRKLLPAPLVAPQTMMARPPHRCLTHRGGRVCLRDARALSAPSAWA